jgi:hypothetical protein
MAERLRDARLSEQVLSFTTGSRSRDARLSAQVLIGPPQKVREARLSVQVLITNPQATGFDGWGIPI